MKKLLAMILGGTGIAMSTFSGSACPIVFVDEPKMPKSMIER